MRLNFRLSVLCLFIFILVMWSIQTEEPFSQKMRPWFGYEPGYGPGWGRSGCCDQAVPKNMSNV
jgi:hypothetical protein